MPHFSLRHKEDHPFFLSAGVGLCCLLLALLPTTVQAQLQAGNTFSQVGSGARAMGQANAFLAVADDATAASWNPAGLAQLERPECSLAGEYWTSHGRILSPDHYRGTEHDTTLVDLNYASLVYPFRFLDRNVTVSLNYLKQFDFAQKLEVPQPDFDDNWTGRGRLRQEGAFSTVSPALAMDLTDHLAAGVAFNIWNDDITGNSSYRVHQVNEASASGAATENQYTIQRGYSLTLGTLYRPVKEWAFAGVVKPPFTLHGVREKQHSYYDPGDTDWTFGPPNRFPAALQMPLMIGGGVAWRPSDPLTVALDLVWTDWSEFIMKQRGDPFWCNRYNPISDRPLSYGRCQDTYTVRLGTEYLLHYGVCQIPLRCGVGYDPEPGVEAVENYYTANLGTGLQWERYAFDIAYEARWGQDVHTGPLIYERGTEDILQHRILISLILYL
jgi:long-subunit fatty acid transport protein